MPRNGSGTYNLPAGNPVVSGSLIQAAWANTTLADLAAALTNSLSSDGQTVPTANLPMGGFRFTNVGAATAAAHVALASQVQAGSFNVVTTVAGGPAAYTGALPLATVTFSVGQTIIFVPNVTSDPLVTLAINGGTANSVLNADGGAIADDALLAGSTYLLVWDGAAWRTNSGNGVFLPLAGGKLTGNLGIKKVPTVELDVLGTMLVTSVGTNQIVGDTVNPALYVTNVDTGLALEIDGSGTADKLGVGMVPTAELDVTGKLRVQSTVTNEITGNTVDPALYVANSSTGLALSLLGRAYIDGNGISTLVGLLYDSPGFDPCYIGSDASENFIVTNKTGVVNFRVGATGWLELPRTGVRFQANFSGALADRFYFQDRNTNTATTVGIIPNGTAVGSTINMFALSDPAASAYLQITANPTLGEVRIYSGVTGAAAYLPITFYVNGVKVTEIPITDGVLTSFLGMRSTMAGTGGYGTTRFDDWINSNGNTDRKRWAWIGWKTGLIDSLELMPLTDAGAATGSMLKFTRDGTTDILYIGSNTKLRTSAGSPSGSPLVFFNDLEVGAGGLISASFVDAGATIYADTSAYGAVVNQSTSTTTHTINFSAAQYYKLTMGHNIATLTLTAPNGPCVVQLELVQSAGSNTMNWPASLKWPANYTATDKLLSTAAAARDLLVLRWNGTDYVANLMKGIA